MPTAIQAALLGVVQGLTEFLPVSSSAHLILARAFFGWNGEQFGLAFDVALHVGTIIAVILYFRREVGRMIVAVPRLARPDDDARLVWQLVVGTIPAVIVGLLFGDAIEAHARTPAVAGVALAVGAVGLIAAERWGGQTRSDKSLTMAEVWWIGCAQALALVPGVSRSGATLTLALFLGLRRGEAARFIFLLSIPAILGAAAKEMPALIASGFGVSGVILATGVVSSLAVSYVVVRWFIRYLGDHSLNVFAWYRLVLAATVVIWIVR